MLELAAMFWRNVVKLDDSLLCMVVASRRAVAMQLHRW